MAPAPKRCLLALLTAGLLAAPLTEPARSEEDWAALESEHASLFTPLPLKAMFSDPDEELKISRRAPYTGAARAEIEQRRDGIRLRRAQIADERKKRLDFVTRVGAAGGPRAAALLMRIYEDQLDVIDNARANLARLDEAARIDINPGVDPGGVYWERWLGKERSAARGIVAAEEKVRDQAFEECVKLRTPEIRAWFARLAEKSEREDVREQTATALALTGDPADAAALGGILEKEREPWARVLFLDILIHHPTPAAAPFVIGSLGDRTWPVRSAAIAAVRALGLRNADAIDGLLAAMEASEGRVRREARDALSEATGQAFGLAPEEWRLWWGANREGWTAPAEPATVAPLDIEPPLVFGVPTVSRRIAILVNRGAAMRKPVKRRPRGNDGKASPDPAVDTALKIAVWELSQALEALDDEQDFVVVVYGAEPHPGSKRLVRPTRENRNRAVALAARFEPEGRSDQSRALDHVLSLGVPRGTKDLARGGEGDVDTVFLVGGGFPTKSQAYRRIRRLRRVVFVSVALERLPTLYAPK